MLRSLFHRRLAVDAAQAQVGNNRIEVSSIDNMRLKHMFFVFSAIFACTVSAQSADDLREKYLASPDTASALKDAIRKRIVVAGMCPFEAFAAAGYPGPYMVRRDEAKWSADTPPPNIINAQCKAPDASTIELLFRNSSQFGGAEPTVFRVRFVNGKVTQIDRKRLGEK